MSKTSQVTLNCSILVHKMVVNCYQNLKFVKTNVLDHWLSIRFECAKLEGFNAVQCSCFDLNPIGKTDVGTLELVY